MNTGILFSSIFCLLIFSLLITVIGQTIKKYSADRIPIGLSYAFTCVLVILILTNYNQFFPAENIFLFYYLIFPVLVVVFFLKFNDYEKKYAINDFISLIFLQIIVLIILYIQFKMYKYWLLEGPNHDSLIYFEGMTWSMHQPLQISKFLVKSKWGLGVCGEGAMWIGNDCALYRGGTYTLAAWIQAVSPSKTGSGLYLTHLYGATILWIAIRIAIPINVVSFSMSKKLSLMVIFFSTIAAISTAGISSILNVNIATNVAAALIALLTAIGLCGSLPLVEKSIVQSLTVALCAHFYAEGIFYAGLIFFIIFLVDIIKLYGYSGARCTIYYVISVSLILLIGANITLYEAIRSLIVFSDIANQGEWFSWYLNQPTWTWIGSFITGLMLGGEYPNYYYVGLGTIVVVISFIVICAKKRGKVGAFALAITSFISISFIEYRGYQYGEHKIIQLLGVAWTVLIIRAIMILIFEDNSKKFKIVK